MFFYQSALTKSKLLKPHWIIGLLEKSGDYCKISNQVVIIIEKSIQQDICNINLLAVKSNNGETSCPGHKVENTNVELNEMVVNHVLPLHIDNSPHQNKQDLKKVM